MIIVVTGAKAAGKSISLAKVAEIIRNNGKRVGGIISPRIWKNGERYGYELVTLADGAKHLLAVETDGVIADPFKYCTFEFSKSVFAAGNKAIKDGLDTDVLIVDEIGNMEISGQGWGESLPLIAARKLPTLLSVRADVVDKLSDCGIKADIIIEVSDGEDTTTKILKALGV